MNFVTVRLRRLLSLNSAAVMAPKKEHKVTKSGKVPMTINAPSPPSAASATLTKNGDMSITLHVKPGSKVNRITEVSSEGVSVQIAAPPVDGEANKEIIKYFAEVLAVSKTSLELKGGKSRQKTLVVSSSSNLSVEQVTDFLKKEAGVPSE